MQAFSAAVFKSGKFSAFFVIVGVLTVCTLAGAYNISAQRKPVKTAVKKKPPPPPQLMSSIVDLTGVCIPPKTDYISVLQIDSSGKATLTGQTVEGSKILFDANALSSAGDALTTAFNKATVTVKVDPGLKLDLVVKILKGLRSFGCMNVEASTNIENPYIYIYPEPKLLENVEVKPNPLTLVVLLDKNGDITLNNESKGSLNDTSLLRNSLRQIFKTRADNGVFREGTNDIETTISVKAENSAKFGDVVKIVDALKEAGASPIGLQIDDLDAATVDSRKLFELTTDEPVSPPSKTRPPKRPTS